jgi:hypothetical protein
MRHHHAIAATRRLGAVARTTTGLALASSLGWLLITPSVTFGTHGGAGLPAVVESERLADGSAPGACRVAGVVQNPSLSETVTVRLSWQGLDATGSSAGVALARIPWLRPGERRPFTSAPFVATTGQALSSCGGIAHFVRLDAMAEPVPVP